MMGELEMAITILIRRNGDEHDAMIAFAKRGKAIIEKTGAEWSLSQVHTGPHTGQWVVAIRYPDWTTYGKANEALASDTTFQKFMSEVGAVSQLVDRTVLVGIDV
jgi:hypothetical protein